MSQTDNPLKQAIDSGPLPVTPAAELSTITKVPFHGDDITCIETPEGVFVPIRPICARLGLDFSAQRKRVNRAPELFGVAIMATEQDAGDRDMVCIRLTRVAYWLATISVNKVKPELRLAVERYQTEAAEVLDRHFRLKEAEKEAEIAHLRSQLACCHDFLSIAIPKWHEIRLLAARQVSLPTIARRVNMAMARVQEEQEMMRDCGMVPMYGAKATNVPALNDRIRVLEAKLWTAERRLSEARAQGELFETEAPDVH